MSIITYLKRQTPNILTARNIAVVANNLDPQLFATSIRRSMNPGTFELTGCRVNCRAFIRHPPTNGGHSPELHEVNVFCALLPPPIE